MDTDKITAFLHKLANAKILTLLIVLGVVAYFVHKNFDFITEITFKVDRPTGSAKQSPSDDDRNTFTSVKVDTNLIPLQFDIPSYLLVTVTNSGPAKAKNMEILVDIGRSKVTSMDIKPKDRCSINSGNSGVSDPIRVVCQEVNVDESVYVYALLSEPLFRSVLVTSPNIAQPTLVKYSDPQNEKGWAYVGAIFAVILIIAGVIALIIVCLYLLGALIRFMEKSTSKH